MESAHKRLDMHRDVIYDNTVKIQALVELLFDKEIISPLEFMEKWKELGHDSKKKAAGE